MRSWIAHTGWVSLLLVSCQRELHFPPKPVVITLPEKIITAIIIYNPQVGDYDSVAFHYLDDKTKETHYNKNGDSITRTFFYDAAGRLSAVEDEKAIYYTNNDRALRIRFEYNAAGQLEQTKTDFTLASGITAHIINGIQGGVKQMQVYDTAYKSYSYNLDWINRTIYSTINSKNYILYDSAVLVNTNYTGLVTTKVSEFRYDADTVVRAISKRIYFNQQLSESGTVNIISDKAAPLYKALRKQLFRNLSNWFDASEAWQDNNYDLFPLPGGPYKSILYTGLFAGNGQAQQSFIRNYEFENTYKGDELDHSQVTYTLSGQGSSRYVNYLKFYYGYK
jgi:hypothetical protein